VIRFHGTGRHETPAGAVTVNEQTQLHEDIRAGLEAYAKLPLKDRLDRLRRIGILTAELTLSERYGGTTAKPAPEPAGR
jgi:hypothetical protein